MKINKYVEDLKAKTSAELNEELVAATLPTSWIIQAELKKFAETSLVFRLLLQRKRTNYHRFLK